MKRLANVSLVAIALAAFAFVAWRFARAQRSESKVIAPVGEIVAATLARGDETPRPSRSAVAERTETATPIDVSSSPTRTVHGRLFVEGDDRRISAADVRLSLHLTNAAHEPARELELNFEGPSFDFTAGAAQTRLLVEGIRVDGWFADPLVRELSLEGAGEVRIDVRWRDGVLLRVVDAVSRAELADVTIVATPQWVSTLDRLALNECRVPTREMQASPLMDHVASPVMLPRSARTEPFWIAAADHAWRRVEIAGDKGERTIALHPASALLVRIPVGAPACNLRFALLDGNAGATLAAEALGRTPEPELLLTHLRPGECTATIECTKGRDGERAASQALVLEPGVTTTWDVAWIAASDFGSLRISVDASSGGFQMADATPTYELVKVGDDGAPQWYVRRQHALIHDKASDRYRATVDKLEPGWWELSIFPSGQVRRVEIAAGVDSLVEFDTARRIEVRVRVVDAISREPLTEASVMYGAAFDGERSTYLFDALESDEGGSAWIVRTELGRVDFAVAAAGYASQRRIETIAVAGQELTFALYKTANLPITLTLAQGQAQFPIPLEDWVKISVESAPTGGAKTLQEFGSTGLSLRSSTSVIRVSAPGSYVLRVPPSVCGGSCDQLVTVDVKDPSGASVALQRVE